MTNEEIIEYFYYCFKKANGVLETQQYSSGEFKSAFISNECKYICTHTAAICVLPQKYAEMRCNEDFFKAFYYFCDRYQNEKKEK